LIFKLEPCILNFNQTFFTMKYLLLLLLFLCIPVAVSAQEQANVLINTTIQDAFSLTKVDDLVFGQVQAGDVVSVASVTNAVSNTGSDAKRATITSTALSATVYTVSGLGFSSNVIQLPYVSGGGVSPASAIAVTLNFAVNSGSPTTYTLGSSTGAGTAAENTLYIGGTFTAPTGDSIGATYSGTIVVSAVYL
jgi:hypothetical protein